MKQKTVSSIIITLFLASSATNEQVSAIQMQNINSRISKLQNLASGKQQAKGSKQKSNQLVQTGVNKVDESLYYDNTGDRWVALAKTYGRDPNWEYHDPHFMANPDFQKGVELKNGYKEESFAQVENSNTVHQIVPSLAQKRTEDSVMDDSIDRWVYWPKTGQDPNPKYHDVHFMLRPDFNTSTLQMPRSFAQIHTKAQDDYKYDDWSGDRWVKYAKGQEPFPPPHDPEWYKKEDFMHSIYQPIKPAKSFVQTDDSDYKYDDWSGDRWVKYARGQEPFPPPHDPEWYKKEDFMHSIYQPIKPAKS